MSAFVIEDEELIQELFKRAEQEGRSVEDFLRLVVSIWPDSDALPLTAETIPDSEVSALLNPSENYPALAQVIERGLAGGLEHRADMDDSVAYIQQLRRKLWERQP